MKDDISKIKFEEEVSSIPYDHIKIRFKIDDFSMEREIKQNDSYETSVKRLFESFINNSMNHHIRKFWKI